MFVTRRSKTSLFFVFDSLSNLDCGQWYKFWIYQSHPMSVPATQCWLTGKSVFFVRSLLRLFILLLNGWTLSPTYRKEVNHIRCFTIDIAKDLILLSCHLAMEHLCVLQLETALATLVTTWFTLADRRWRSRYSSSDQCILNAFRSPERYNGWFREQLGQHFTFVYPPQRSCRGVYWFHHVCPSVCRQILCRTITWVMFLWIF
jgi:hypothetical protein